MLDQPQWSRHDVASTTRAGGEDDAPLSRSSLPLYGNKIYFILFQREVVCEAPCMLDQPQWSRHDVASTTRAEGGDDHPLSRPARAAISYYELWCGDADVILCITHPWWSMHDVARGRRGRRSSLLQYGNKISYFISFQCGDTRVVPCMLDQPQWSRHDVASTTRAGGEDDAPLSCGI